jgi:hypothetical protein
MLARDLGYAHTRECLENLDEIARMLRSYITAIARSRFNVRSFFFFF